MSETMITIICSVKYQKTNLTTVRDIELILSLMADLLLRGYTVEDVSVCLGHRGEEGDVVVVSFV